MPVETLNRYVVRCDTPGCKAWCVVREAEHDQFAQMPKGWAPRGPRYNDKKLNTYADKVTCPECNESRRKRPKRVPENAEWSDIHEAWVWYVGGVRTFAPGEPENRPAGVPKEAEWTKDRRWEWTDEEGRLSYGWPEPDRPELLPKSCIWVGDKRQWFDPLTRDRYRFTGFRGHEMVQPVETEAKPSETFTPWTKVSAEDYPGLVKAWASVTPPRPRLVPGSAVWLPHEKLWIAMSEDRRGCLAFDPATEQWTHYTRDNDTPVPPRVNGIPASAKLMWAWFDALGRLCVQSDDVLIQSLVFTTSTPSQPSEDK